VVTGTGLTGCSDDPDAGTNGVGKLPAAQIQQRALTAASGAATVRLSGSVVSGRTTYKLDIKLSDGGASGAVTSKDTTFQLLRVGEALYLKAGAAFWRQEDGKGGDTGATAGTAAEKLGGKYVKVPEEDPAYKRFSGFTDKDTLLTGLLTLHGTVSTDGRHEVDGVRTVRVAGGDGSGGALDVSLEGKPYPLRLSRAGNAGALTLTDWGESFTPKAPAAKDTVDYGRNLPTG
jgi:hypothetical protein